MKKNALLALMLLLLLADVGMAQLTAQKARTGPAEFVTSISREAPALPGFWLPGSQRPLPKACTPSCLTSCAQQNDLCNQRCNGDPDCENVCSDGFLWCQCGCCNWLC